MSEAVHPARSSEFLSRLHDGEVAGAERAAFDAHARTCDECRASLDAFERALSAYRGAEPLPAAADLSARILRRIRAQSPARRPFGVAFGIDLRWVGVSVAAVLALLVAVPLLLRPRASPLSAPDTLSSHLVVAETESGSEPKPEAPPAPPLPEPASGAARPKEAPASRQKKDSAPAPPSLALAPPAAPSAMAAGKDTATNDLSAEAPVVDSGGAAPNAAPRAFSNSLRARVSQDASPRLSVQAVDEGGPAPAVIAMPQRERLSPLHGREFLVVLDVAGRVATLEAGPSEKSRLAEQGAAAVSDAAALEILRTVRFEAGQGPRRLLLRIE